MGIFDIFKKKEEPIDLAQTVPKPPETQVGMNKQQVLNCIQSGGGNCDSCASIKKCLKLKRQLKKLGLRG